MNAKLCIFPLLLSCAGTAMAVESKLNTPSVKATTDLKIRFIDTFAAMRESTEGVKVADTIEKQRDGIAKQIEANGKKLEARDKEVRAKMSTMSKEALNKEEVALTKMKRDLENQVRDGEETLKLSMQQATENLARKVEKAVDAYAKAEQPDAIIDKTTGRVVYTSGKADITDMITAQMNAEYAAAKPKVGGAATTVGAAAPTA
jgi:Skp family chaperone for outer membrane proteins